MREIIPIYKKIGETPLQALNRLRYERLEFANQNMTYLGRLDPMAEGLMLVLVGDTQDKEEYLSYDKEYEFEVLWGFETDTYDLLGLIAQRDVGLLARQASTDSKFAPLNPQAGSDTDANFESVLAHVRSLRKQKYPPYSSKKVDGRQLFEWAREGIEVESPEREINIYSFEHLGERGVSGKELLRDIEERVGKVRGDFRQNQVVGGWREILQGQEEKKFIISKFRAHVSSGTYIRGLVQDMGQELGCGALAYSIKRTKVGEYSL